MLKLPSIFLPSVYVASLMGQIDCKFGSNFEIILRDKNKHTNAFQMLL